jgi:hypothetical protein
MTTPAARRRVTERPDVQPAEQFVAAAVADPGPPAPAAAPPTCVDHRHRQQHAWGAALLGRARRAAARRCGRRGAAQRHQAGRDRHHVRRGGDPVPDLVAGALRPGDGGVHGGGHPGHRLRRGREPGGHRLGSDRGARAARRPRCFRGSRPERGQLRSGHVPGTRRRALLERGDGRRLRGGVRGHHRNSNGRLGPAIARRNGGSTPGSSGTAGRISDDPSPAVHRIALATSSMSARPDGRRGADRRTAW